MRFFRNAKWIVRVSTLVYFDVEKGVERRIDTVKTMVAERPGNRVPKLPPRRLDVHRRIVQPCRARWRMGRKGRNT